jgi:hypothetical protein
MLSQPRPAHRRSASFVGPSSRTWQVRVTLGNLSIGAFIMKTLLVLVIALAVVSAVLLWLKMRTPAGDDNASWPYYAKDPLTQAELVLYERLVAALPRHIVLAQVQVSRLLGVKKGFNFHEWNNRINRLSYDFVVCSKDARVIAVIELDDQTHDLPDRVVADKKKDRATASAQFRLIRWRVTAMPEEAEIQTAILAEQPLAESFHKPSGHSQAARRSGEGEPYL